MTRGIRNNNPCNIRRSRVIWQGEVSKLNGMHDKAFCQFASMKMGLRAAFVLMRSYRNIHRLYDIDGVIKRWAPPEDGNDTEAYIKFVAHETGISRDDYLKYTDLMKVVKAMCKIESNYTPNHDELRAAFYMVFD